MADGMTVRSPSSKSNSNQQRDMEDVEIGRHPRVIKAKDSNVEDLSPPSLIGEGKSESSSEQGGGSSAMKSLVASTMYSGCSVGMVLVNKSLASR
jgi:hypothetical protein